MICFHQRLTLNLRRLSFIGMIFLCGVTAVAQTTDSTPLTPAQQRAQARAAQQAAAKQAAEERQAAAKQAAEARQAAAKQAAESRQMAKQTGQTNAANRTNPAMANTAPNAASGTQRMPAAAANPASGTGSSGTVGSGTLSWQTRVYSSSGCAHNGNSAVCTFTFVNQGNEATLTAGSELAGIQLVDDAHVPHRATQAHFLDKYGTQQPKLVLQPGDTGTYVVTFGNVNSQVSSADFHLRTQIVGGVTFSEAQPGSANKPSMAAGTASPK